jgi:hypothetical protein
MPGPKLPPARHHAGHAPVVGPGALAQLAAIVDHQHRPRLDRGGVAERAIDVAAYRQVALAAVENHGVVAVIVTQVERAATALAADRQRRLRRKKAQHRDVVDAQSPRHDDLAGRVEPDHGVEGCVSGRDAGFAIEKNPARAGGVEHHDLSEIAVQQKRAVAAAVLNLDGAVSRTSLIDVSPQVSGRRRPAGEP